MALLLSKTRAFSASFLSLTQTQSRRARSTLSGCHDALIEVDLSSSSSSEDGESEAVMIKKLDNIVQRMIVQRATPDWLPFLPGYSFWVPPRRGPYKFAELVDNLNHHLSPEESLSLSSDRGWPCTHFLIDRSRSGQTREFDSEESSDMEGEGLTDSEGMHPCADKKG